MCRFYTHLLLEATSVRSSTSDSDIQLEIELRKEVTWCACKLKRTVLHYQDAIEEPVEDDTNKLRIGVITGKPRVVACALTDGPKLDVYRFSNAFFLLPM